MYYTYILKCSDNSYYVGSSDNLSQRLKDHNQHKGADFTSTRVPSVIIWFQKFNNKSLAIKKELEIKKFSRFKKENRIFSTDTVWKHYKGNKYIILWKLDNLILYSEYSIWEKYLKAKNKKGEQCQVWLRSQDQWLDWIDKDKKLLRFNRIMAE